MKERTGIGGAVQPKLGKQLSTRVSSGAIAQKQATRTARQRRTFANTYGDNWRKKVYGNEAGKLGELRKSASEGDFGSKNKLGELRERRKRLLKRAGTPPTKGPSIGGPSVGQGEVVSPVKLVPLPQPIKGKRSKNRKGKPLPENEGRNYLRG